MDRTYKIYRIADCGFHHRGRENTEDGDEYLKSEIDRFSGPLWLCGARICGWWI